MEKSLKFGLSLLAILCLVLVAITIIDFPLDQKLADLGLQTEEIPNTGASDPDLVTAVEIALVEARGRWQIFKYKIDHIQVQDDGMMAIVWLAALDPETGDPFEREPELAIAELGPNEEWRVLLQDEGVKFTEAFEQFQYAEKSVLDGDLLTGEVAPMAKSGTVFGGYFLPWAAGLEKRLTWSVGHTSCSPIYYCTRAFDFADGTMFPLVAAKGGTVFHWKDTCNNGDPYCTNSITLQDRSTTPWTYQIYLHIAKDSVPQNLKQVGTPVLQGQYIADVDDTGASTGHHVHFMVVTEDTRYFSYTMHSYWGVAEDITFRDVDINWDPVTQGGRPRLAYEAETYGGEGRTYYVSGNQPANPPTGGLTAPGTKILVTDPVLTVSGWGKDDVGVKKYEILGYFGYQWHSIGDGLPGTSFTIDLDLCEAAVPDGPFGLALRVWDYEGNPSPILSVRQLIKDVQCEESGVEPKVNLNLKDGILALPQYGLVSANVTKGSTDSDISSVEFWFNKHDWERNQWVYLGKDVNGLNGWQAPISTAGLPEGDNYAIITVATDLEGNQDADISFSAYVDATPPWLNMDPIRSPILNGSVTLNWSGGDDLTGIDHYALAVNVDDQGYQTLESNMPGTKTSYDIPVEKEQLLVIKLTAFDKSGNQTTQKMFLYTEDYIFEFQYTLPWIFSGAGD